MGVPQGWPTAGCHRHRKRRPSCLSPPTCPTPRGADTAPSGVARRRLFRATATCRCHLSDRADGRPDANPCGPQPAPQRPWWRTVQMLLLLDSAVMLVLVRRGVGLIRSEAWAKRGCAGHCDAGTHHQRDGSCAATSAMATGRGRAGPSGRRWRPTCCHARCSPSCARPAAVAAAEAPQVSRRDPSRASIILGSRPRRFPPRSMPRRP